MEFARKKLPPTAAPQLRVCRIESVPAYAPMLAPVYVFLKENGKYIAVKAPLDFFTPEELERLKPYGQFFLPECVDRANGFREAARRVGIALRMEVPDADGGKQPPAPYEISDAVMRIIGPLWGGSGSIEPFFLAAFAGELCSPLPQEELAASRERDVLAYETAWMRSGTAVFLALHLGILEPKHLDRLRLGIFREALGQSPGPRTLDADELAKLVARLVPHAQVPPLDRSALVLGESAIEKKIASRVKRAVEQLLDPTFQQPTIRGEEGFSDG
jgi:hypothetical protein